MGELRLFAIGIDEARDMFAASPEVADQLRASSQHLFAPPPRKRGMLDRLGPFSRKSLLPDPNIPMPADAEDLLAGRFVRPDRVPAAWVLVEHWLGEISWGVYTTSVTDASLDAWDFALARAGLSSTYGIGRLFNEELGFPVRPLPGQETGYVSNGHALAAIDALTQAVDDVEGDPALWTKALLDWLSGYPQWAESAAAAGRPHPDLVGLLTR